MFSFLDCLRDMNSLAVILRILAAALCGGLIGLEREFKRRPAGFRTHILVCLGACLTTMTSQYLSIHMHYFTDIGRLGAQVINGIGFLGAGTIIVTRRLNVKGLTTAAGMWVCAIIGLSIGAGFIEGSLIATALVLLAELVFARMEFWIFRHSRQLLLYIEYSDPECLDRSMEPTKKYSMRMADLEISRSAGNTDRRSAIVSLRPTMPYESDALVADLRDIPGMVFVEEL